MTALRIVLLLVQLNHVNAFTRPKTISLQVPFPSRPRHGRRARQVNKLPPLTQLYDNDNGNDGPADIMSELTRREKVQKMEDATPSSLIASMTRVDEPLSGNVSKQQ